MKKNLTKIIHALPRYFSPGLKLTLSFLVLLMAQISVNAQDKTVSGKIVSPAGEPLFGVTVSVKNANKKTTTGPDGNFF